MKFSLLFNTMSAAILTFVFTSAWCQQSSAIDCSTAEQDIKHLQNEKNRTDEHKVKGVMAILPIGMAINAVSSIDDESNKEMHVDEYHKRLDERIEEIKQACNIQ